jgi:hypothetical protein
MLKKLQMIVVLVAISCAAVAQDWIEVNSGLANGNGVGQISVGMNDSDALWGAAIDATGAIVDAFTRSTDGGQTWTAGTFNAGTGLSMVFAIDANTCWAAFNTGANQGLYKTTDGGTTWVKKGGVYGASSFANVVHFFNDTDGFAQGDPVGGYFELYTTTDGGESWTRVPQANIPAPTTGEYGITGNYSAVGNSIWYGTNAGRVFYSSDKGMTWGATLTPFGATNVVQPLFKNENVGIAFRSYLDMGLEPTLNVTTDGGITWTALNVTGDMRARWFDYIPGTTGTWVGSSAEAGAEGISFSIDDGANWNDLTVGVPVLAPEFIDNQTGWAGTWVVGNAGGILIYNGDPIGGGSGAEITEDFETYTAGSKLVQQALAQGIDYWTCWSGDGGAGGAEDPVISTDQSNGGNNSVMCSGTNDFVMKFGDKTGGKYSVDFYIYIPTGFVGYYNILQSWTPGGTGATWGLEVYFDPGGIAKITAANTTPYETFNYAYDTWIHIENIINLNTDMAAIVVDGTEVASWEWSIGASGSGINALAAMDIYAAATNGTPKFYVDDIQLIELEPAVGPAQITVSPASFNIELEAGASTTETLTIGNDGIAKLVWSAYPEYAMGKSTATFKPLDYSNISIPEAGIVESNGGANAGGTDDVVTLNYDGDNASAVGLTNGGSFEVGAMFPVSITNNYIGMMINEVQVYVNEPVTASAIKIYGHGTDEMAGELLHEQSFSHILGWNNITLTSPVVITGGDIWVSLAVTHNAGLFPAGCDAGPAVTNGDWFKSGAAWVPMHIANPDLNANWNIRAIAEGTPMSGFITLNPASGQINSGNTTDVTVTFDAEDLTTGSYAANIVINSNDPANPQMMVPVTLTVTGEPNPLDPPTNLDYEILNNKDVHLTWTSPVTPSFFEGFEGTFPPAGWAKLNPDGGTGWAQVAVGTTPLPGWTGSGAITAPPDGGQYQAYATWNTGGAASNDQWIVTPQITVTESSMLEFYMIYYINTYIDNVEILISTTSQTNTSAFTTVVDEINFTAASSTEWELYSYDLTDFVSAGTQVYIAFREKVADNFNDGSAISIDNVYVGDGSKLAAPVPSITPIDNSSITRDLNYTFAPVAPKTFKSTDAFIGFNVYRDNVKINSTPITASEYTDMDLSEGTYNYCVTAVYDEGESDCSNEVTVVIVGIDDPANATFNIYPNPANEVVNISSAVTVTSIKLMNYTGQIVYSNQTSATQFSINTNDIAAGVYVLQLETENGTSSRKLIIE